MMVRVPKNRNNTGSRQRLILFDLTGFAERGARYLIREDEPQSLNFLKNWPELR
jgi:hypothetical protein